MGTDPWGQTHGDKAIGPGRPRDPWGQTHGDKTHGDIAIGPGRPGNPGKRSRDSPRGHSNWTVHGDIGQPTGT